MAYPDYTTVRSIAGAAEPTYLEDVLASGYVNGQTISVDNTLNWYEVSSSGTATTNPLGTSGIFVLVVDYGQDNEEKILCASGAITIGNFVDIPIWTDGVRNGRGYDGTAISAHSVGIGTTLNVFPVRTAVDDRQYNDATIVLGYAYQYLSAQQLIDEGNLSAVSGSVTSLSGQYVVLSGQVADQSNYIAIISGQQSADEANIATLSGQYVTLSNSYNTTSGIVTNQTGYISTISGKQVTDEANIATLSGQMVTANSQISTNAVNLATLSGQYNTTSGIVTNHTSYIATISGKQVTDEANIATLSGHYYTTSGIVTNQTSYIATISGKQVTDEANIATLSGQYATTSGIVTNHTSYIATLSGQMVTANANIASTSGSLATLSGQYVATSGIVTNQTGYIATISGKQITDETNIASLSGSLATLSGQYVTTSGIVTSNTSNIASTSGSLSTLSGQFVTLSGQYYTTSGIVTNQTSYIATLSGQMVTANSNIASTSGSLATLSGQFVTLSGKAVVSGTTANGDLSGTYPSPKVAKIQGTSVSPTAPSNNQVLRYSTASGAWYAGTGNALFPTATISGNYTATPNDYVVANVTVAPITVTLPNAPSNGSVISVASLPTSTYNVVITASGSDTIPGGNFTLAGNTVFNSVSFYYDSARTEWLIQSNQFGDVAGGDLGGYYPNPTVDRLQGTPVSNTPPNAGQVLASVGGVWTPITSSGIGTPGPGGANGYWFAGYDTTNQTLTTVLSGKPILIGTPTNQNGIVSSASGTITIGYTGTYNFQFSVQFQNSDNAAHNANVWLRKNGANLAETNGTVAIPRTGGTGNGYTISSWNYIVAASGGDKFQFMWTADDTHVSIIDVAGLGTAPNSPGFIATVQQVMYNQTGTYTVNAIAASGTNQATATPLTLSTYAPITGATASGNNVAGTGVVLATPTYNGQWMQIHNQDTANWLLVYPNSGATIDQEVADGPIWIPPSAFWEGVATTTLSWDTKTESITSTTINVSYQSDGGQAAINLPSTGSPGTYGTASGVPVVTTDAQGRVSNVTVTGIQIAQNQVTGLSGNLSALSGSITTTNSNLATLSGQYVTSSGILTTATGNINSLSGSLSTLSGQFTTLSGQYNTTSGIVTTATGNISSLSGSLNTVSGVAYAALPISGGTITGNLTVNGTTTITGNNFNLYSSILNGVSAAYGQAIVYSGGKWVPGTVATAGNSNALANTYYTNVSGAQGPINIYTATASGFLLFNYYAKVTATGTTSKLGPITLTSTDPDGNTIVNTGNSTSANSTVSGFINGVIPVLVASGSTVSYSMGYASSGTNMQYEVYTQLASSNLSVSSGVVSSFNGRTGAVLPSVGDYTSVISTDNRTSQSGSINSVTLATASGTGFFFFNHYAKITTSGSAGSILGPVSITTVDPDGTTVTNFGPFTSNNTITSGIINTVIPVYVASGTNITYSLGYTSSGSTMKYESYGMLSSTQVAPAVSIGVTSFNGRTGAITPAIGDYTASQVGALPILGGTVSGNLVVASGLTVSGTATINNNLIVASGLTISGTVTALSGFVGSLTNASGLSLTTGVTGLLTVANGGTNLTTFTAANNALYSTSSNALTAGTLPIAAGGTGANGASGALANLGGFPLTGGTINGTTTFSGNVIASGININGGTFINSLLTGATESAIVSTVTLGASQAAILNTTSGALYLYTTNPTGNYQINITNVPTIVGRSISFALGVINGATAYLPSGFLINGYTINGGTSLPAQGTSYTNTITVTAYYQGGTAWSSADASHLNFYNITLICTGTNTYAMLLAETKF